MIRQWFEDRNEIIHFIDSEEKVELHIGSWYKCTCCNCGVIVGNVLEADSDKEELCELDRLKIENKILREGLNKFMRDGTYVLDFEPKGFLEHFAVALHFMGQEQAAGYGAADARVRRKAYEILKEADEISSKV